MSKRKFISIIILIHRLIKLGEQLRSPTFQPQHDSNSTKPKWEIRLPQLLNTTVGPDRQVISLNQNILLFFSSLFKKRDLSRRHTTHVVLQQQEQKPAAFIPSEKEVELIFFLLINLHFSFQVKSTFTIVIHNGNVKSC